MEVSDERLLNYLEGDLNAHDVADLEQLIAADVKLKARLEELRLLISSMENARQHEPPASLRWQFEAALAEEASRASGAASMWGWRVAAAVVLLIIGFGAGRVTISEGTDSQLLALQSELTALRQDVMTSSLENPSASERIHTVHRIEKEVAEASPDLLKTLINILKGDQSPNVRYAAIEALEPYMGAADVRLQVVEALESQTDPILQIAIINWLVEAEEQAAIGAIKKLINQEHTSPEVKQQAKLAIDILI